MVFYQSCLRELSKNSQEPRIPGKLEIIKDSKNLKKLLTIQKTDDIISELRLRKTGNDKKQEQKLSKGFEKKLKKFLTSRKQHDKISKLSVRRQDKNGL